MGGIDFQMIENPLDHVGGLDTRDTPKLAAAALARFDIDGEHALQARGPGHGAITFGVGFAMPSPVAWAPMAAMTSAGECIATPVTTLSTSPGSIPARAAVVPSCTDKTVTPPCSPESQGATQGDRHREAPTASFLGRAGVHAGSSPGDE
jgi:hypothetical protein